MFGQNLKRIRESQELTQTELARRAGLSAGHISLLESGQRRPLLETALILAAALECKPEALYEAPTPTEAATVAA